MKLVFATHNQNKFEEVKALMPHSIDLLSLTDIGCNEPIEETGQTLSENALIKSHYVKNHYGLDCFSDDTGLMVDALNGAPGVYSARYAGTPINSEKNMEKLLNELSGAPKREARFETVIALLWQGQQHLFTGVVTGNITELPRGNQGFGYDPIFKPENYMKTFAELPFSIKNKISHRSRAVAQLIDYLNKNA